MTAAERRALWLATRKRTRDERERFYRWFESLPANDIPTPRAESDE